MNRLRVLTIAAFPLVFLASLPTASAETRCSFPTDLHVGSQGALVSCLQVSLLEQGYLIPAGPTGYFGRETRAAVAAWQKNVRVFPAAGYFGPLSRQAYAIAIAAPQAAAVAPAVAFVPPEPAPALPAAAGGGGGAVSGPVSPATASSASVPVSVPVQTPPRTPVPTAAPGVSEITGTLSSALGQASGGSGSVLWSCDFENGYCGLYEQSALEPSGHRSSFTTTARTGSRAIKLETQPGDVNIHGSGAWERDDLELPPSPDYCNEGQVEWWAASVYFPADYVTPKEGLEVMDFHDNASGGQANLNLVSRPDGTLAFVGYGGDFAKPMRYDAALGALTRGTWYDFVYHVKWSSAADGRMTVWLGGTKVLDYQGPTLYQGISCYFKLADYHDALGVPEPLIFDHIVRGTSASAVSLTPLQ